MQREAKGFAEVTFNGVPQRVTFVSVGGDYPKQKWHLAFMLPHEVIEAPVTEAFWNACFVALGIMLLVGITVWLMLLPFRRQLGKLLDAMEDIAEGDSDLSQRILMEREDELGKLGDAFNRFAEKVQQMLLHTRHLTQEVGTGVMDARQVCDLAVSSVSSQNNKSIQWPRPLPKWRRRAKKWRLALNGRMILPKRHRLRPMTVLKLCPARPKA